MTKVNFLRMTPPNIISGSTHYLLESWGGVEYSNINESLNASNIIQMPKLDSASYKDGEIYITGTFMQADIVNGNRRVYPRSILDSALNEYLEKRVRRGKAIGEWTHPPDRVEADHTKAVLLIEDLWWEGNDVKGRAIVTTGDYAEGDKIASLLRIGWKPSVSSRGVGRLEGNMKRDGYMTVSSYRISVGIDFVNDPSAPDANVDVVGFNESLEQQESVTINKDRRLSGGVANALIENLRNYVNSN